MVIRIVILNVFLLLFMTTVRGKSTFVWLWPCGPPEIRPDISIHWYHWMLSNCKNWKRQSPIAVLLNWSKFIGMSIYHILALQSFTILICLILVYTMLSIYFIDISIFTTFCFLVVVVLVVWRWRSTSVMRLADSVVNDVSCKNFIYLPTLLLWKRHKSGVVVQLRCLSFAFTLQLRSAICMLYSMAYPEHNSIAISQVN